MHPALIGFDNVVRYLPTLERVLVQRPNLAGSAVRLPATELAARSAEQPGLQLIDVRNTAELAAGAVPGTRHIPVVALVTRMSELNRHASIVVYCASGYRSSIAASVLRAGGFTRVTELRGGFEAWSTVGLPIQHHHWVSVSTLVNKVI